MMKKHTVPSMNASRIQEAIDMIVQTFDHPQELSLQYAVDDGTKRTVIKIQTDEKTHEYEVSYDGQRDGAEPMLTRLD